MALNYTAEIIGTMTLKQVHQDDHKTYSYKLEFRSCNALACVIHVRPAERKEGEVSPMLLGMVGAFEGARDLAKQLKEEQTKLCKWLISQSDRDDITPEFAKALRAKALERLGEKVYLTALLEMGSPLNEHDRELMKAHLN